MNLISDLRGSVYDPEYYKGLLKKPFSYSLKYFFFLALSLAFIGALLSLFTVLPNLNSFLQELGPKILSHYPQDLVITIKDGVVSTSGIVTDNWPHAPVVRLTCLHRAILENEAKLDVDH